MNNPHVNSSMDQHATDFLQLIRTVKSRKAESNETISSARYEVLNYLHRHGAQSLSSISSHRKVTNATMSKIVVSLIEEELILKANSKLDKRSKLFFISRKGTELLEQQDSLEINEIQNLMLELSFDEQENLEQCISILRKLIQ